MLDPMQDQDVPEPSRSALLLSLLAKRKEAIDGRADSGIEQEWLEDEDHYEGIDDANRRFSASARRANAKRWANSDEMPTESQGRSVVFLNITAPSVDAASANVSDKLLPTDDRSWCIKPTPITTEMRRVFAAQGVDDAAVEAAIEESKAKAAAMQEEIDDCLTEANWHGEVRKIVEDAARIGSGVLKGPYPVKTTSKIWRADPATGVSALISASEINPSTKRIDPWQFWPDPSCGENVQDGSYTWELELLSSRKVREMLDMPGYDREAIAAALGEGPKNTFLNISASAVPVGGRKDEQFQAWIFYGIVDADDLYEAGVDTEDETPKASAMAVILNDRLVKVALNVLDSGDFPYDVLAWQRRSGMPWGTGVSRKIRTVQRILNAGVRSMMDNAGLSAGLQIVIGNGITPADNKYAITGRKIWRAEAEVVDVRSQFYAFAPPSIQAELMAIVQWAMKVAEDVTGLPTMLQGIRGDAPDTLGGMQMAQNNSSSTLRRIAKRMDDYVTEPHITRYYEWQMQHSPRNDIKGDFQIDVRASSSLVERDAQQQFMSTLLAQSRDPVYGISPKRLAKELIKGQRIDPQRVLYSQDEMAEMEAIKPNPVEEAKTALLQAQGHLARVTAVNKSVEGMFSATSAANQIAIQPTIAPMADEMLMSAGFVDANAAPAIPNAPPGAAGMPMRENTSPNFPPNPDVGMDHGIETGATQDGDEEFD
jgi:hypothetical protein